MRRNAHDVIHDLKHLGLKDLTILTGDREAPALAVARKVHIKRVESELTPAGKADWIDGRRSEGRIVAMVGDGINDAPALARADVGLALAGVGGDLAAEAGSVVLMGDPLASLPETIRLARHTVRVIRQNILLFAFGLNSVAIVLAGLRVLGPVAAAVLHQVGSLLVLLSAIRILGFGRWHTLGIVRAAVPVVAACRRCRPSVVLPVLWSASGDDHPGRGGARDPGVSRLRGHDHRTGPGRRGPTVRTVPAPPAPPRSARPMAVADRGRDGGRARSFATGPRRPDRDRLRRGGSPWTGARPTASAATSRRCSSPATRTWSS